VPYMKPQYNGNTNLIHWLSDIKIDPFDSNRAVFNTGTGVFMTENLQDGKLLGKKVVWRPRCKGIEETVHLNVYSPPAGEVKLIDIIGDLGGFAFTDLNKPCENSFADERGNRYITCLNADYSDNNPLEVAVTSRGNWKGKTTGGLIWSDDQCKTWLRLPDPLGITDKIDKLIESIRKPNTNSGWTALSADGKTLVWAVGEGNILPIDTVVYTENLGKTWHKSTVYDLDGKKIEDINVFQEISKLQDTIIDKDAIKTMKVISDRVDPEVFYGFGDDSLMYISTDRARTFYQLPVSEEFPELELGGMDGRMPAEIRAESAKEGIVWISTGDEGLWKLTFDKDTKKADFLRVSKKGDKIYRQGMGKEAPESTCKTLYVNGIIDGDYGFYRSLDEGMTWERINDEKQMYGDIRSIVGDPREFGRFYIATGSRGVLWGQPK
ncbi:MAG TPA: endoglucanase, partial [Clostridiales bacterium]|nr:endoglucanase [Clostridiales bacterium]